MLSISILPTVLYTAQRKWGKCLNTKLGPSVRLRALFSIKPAHIDVSTPVRKSSWKSSLET